MKTLMVIGLLSVTVGLWAESSLQFGAANSHRVNHGSDDEFDNLQEFTIAAWVRPTTLTNSRTMFGKSNAFFYRLSGTGGNVSLFRQRATGTPTQYTTSSSPTVVNTWTFFCVTYSTFVTPSADLYFGTQSTPLTEASYSEASDGIGNFASDASGSVIFGNSNAGNAAIQGNLAYPRFFNKKLSQAECAEQMFSIAMTTNTILASNYGFNGTGGQWNLTGQVTSSGTVTGATASLLGPPVFIR